MTTPADLVVRPLDQDEHKWGLVDLSAPAGTDPVWGDYATQEDAEGALRRATIHPGCGHRLTRVDGTVCVDAFCNNSFDERQP